MEDKLFDIGNFNVIQDEDNYYFFRALNMEDNNDIEQGITRSNDGKIERIRTDRERYEGIAKYGETSRISLEEVYDHIKMHHRKDTNCISLTSNGNVAVGYGRGTYKDRYTMVKIPKEEIGREVVTAGQYMLQEVYARIEETLGKLSEDEKEKILGIFEEIDKTEENKTLQNMIAKRYSAKKEELNPSKAHLRKGIVYSSPTPRISSYQALSERQLLEVNRVYAKLAVLENENKLKHVIEHLSNSKLREGIGNAFSSMEVIHYGDIAKENIIEIPKEVADIFAIVQQAEGIDKSRVEEVKRALIEAVQSGKEIPQISEIKEEVKDDISIEEMYEITGGKVEYGRAKSIVNNMFYLSKSRQNAIALSNVLEEILGDNSEYADVIDYVRDDGFRIEPEIITRESNQGIKLSEAVSLNISKEEQNLIEEIKKLSHEELNDVLENGGLLNIQNIISKVYGNDKNSQIDKSRYYAEAIIDKYNWQDIGIEGFKIAERNELVARLQGKNCEEIYNRLNETGIEESKIPKILLNIAMRERFYEEYEQRNIEELLSTKQDILQDNINIELVERFLGYYDIENTEIRLKDYQQRAYNHVDKIFNDKKFAQVILPTGAGKSFVALAQMQKYASEHQKEKMLYLAPQDEILNQMKRYITKYIHGKQNTVGKSEEEIIAEVFPNITFETYSGLLAKRGEEITKEEYGMIVLDELHRTGAKEWEGKVNELLENQGEDVKVLGITATPTRDVDGRDMAEETAKKLGYTEEEVKQGKHIASNMTLENAIRMGYVVNPKLVYCKYDLIASGKMDRLIEKIEGIEDQTKKAEEIKKYFDLRTKLNEDIDKEIGEEARKKLEEEARKNLDSGIGKEEILKQNVKKGGKYIVFLPVSDQGDIEDEDGNRIGTKTGEDKILAYQDYINKVFEGTEIVPQLHSLLGSYSKDKNKEELEAFESDRTDDTKFMVVMNKLNEGIHVDGVDGIIWFRALDENSRILYLQQLGRAIYAIDEDNPVPEDKRPVVVDLANNTLTVKMEKEFNKTEPMDDLEALTMVTEWINEHDGIMPDKNSSSKQEQHYYAILRRVQNKYGKYLDGFEGAEDLTQEDKTRIQEVIGLASEIDLWDAELPPIPRTRGKAEQLDPFAITGVLKDYVEFENEIDSNENATTYEKVIEWLETHEGKLPGQRKEATKEEVNLYNRWHNSEERKKLDEYVGVLIEEIPEKYREKIARLRELIVVKKTAYEEVIEWLETHECKLPGCGKKATEAEKKLAQRWNDSKERKKLEEYAGVPIEEIPEEYREKIARLREYGLGERKKTAYEEVIEWLEAHECKLPGYGKKATEAEKKLAQRWNNSKERKKLEEYEGVPIEEIPEEYREKIARLREYGLGERKKTAYEEVIEWLESHDGKLPNQRKEVNLYKKWYNSEERKKLEEYEGVTIEEIPEGYREKIARLRELIAVKKTTYEKVIEWLETHECKLPGCGKKATEAERRLYDSWYNSEERKKLYEYVGVPIEEIPEEYREKIARLREYGLGERKKTAYEEIIEWLETHGGKLPSAGRKGATEEEVNLYKKWYKSKERKKLEEYAEVPIEEIPEEYREKISRLRELIVVEKTAYEEVIEWLETHEGKLPGCGKKATKEEGNLYQRWYKSEERKKLEEYAGVPIEEIPEEYREKIARLREYGLGEKKRTAYEEVIEWLETHEGKLPGNGKKVSKEEKNLYQGWYKSEERKKLEEYAGVPIDEVPEEYREKIAKLREFGIMGKRKLSKVKQQRDEAKSENDKAKELEKEVEEELKRKGRTHAER